VDVVWAHVDAECREVEGAAAFALAAVFAVVLTVVAVGGAGGGVLASVGFGAAAVSLHALAWWCARFWYAAFCKGRRTEPVPEPDSYGGLIAALVGAAVGMGTWGAYE
jgi:hypothetical protein